MSVASLPLPFPEAESERLDALDRCGVLDTAPEPAFDDLARLATVMCGTPAAAVVFIDRDRIWFKARIGVDAVQVSRSPSSDAHAAASAAGAGVHEAVVDRDGCAAPAVGGAPMRYLASAAVRDADGFVLGGVCVADTAARTLAPAQREGLALLARQAAHLLALRRQAREHERRLAERRADAERAAHAHAELELRHARLVDSARRDPLTGLLTRAALATLLERIAPCERTGHAGYCLIVLDIDHFKRINDCYGHLLGDRALQAVADVLKACVRETDLAVRFGGEEFVVALPGAALPEGAEVAHRLRECIEALALPFPLTASIGLSSGDACNESVEQVFMRADQALYRAKAAGRNRVVIDDTPRH